MKELSIIIPFAGEYPQAIFTVQAIAESLKDKIDFEIIVVNNYCSELKAQWDAAKQKAINHLNGASMIQMDDLDKVIQMMPVGMNNKAAEAFKASARGNEWLTYMEYDGRLSHWECKRLACQQAKSDTFLFIDSHCIPSKGIPKMFYDYAYSRPEGYDEPYRNLGTFHMPLTYKILEWHRLIYKMVVEKCFYGYSFTSMREDEVKPFEVPVMSCCGVMLSREIYDRIGGWPVGMYAYGGGENFLNYSLAVTGHTKWIYPDVTLHHHGERRDYHYTYDGTLMNRLIAHYLFGGTEKLGDLVKVSKGRPEVLRLFVETILQNEDLQKHREIIKNNQVIKLDDWVSKWQG